MTTSYAESVPSLTSKSSKFYVYQTDDKPLSAEAIYRAKLKYGIYNNPERVNLGVDPSASDTAAVLAANTDLSIHGYSKELSSEAAHAALIAKPGSIDGYKRTSVAPEAEYAAISAKSLKFPFDSSTTSTYNNKLEDDAASAVLKKTPHNIARDSLQDIYDFDDIRSGKATLSQFSIPNSKSAKSLSSKKDYRSGITTSNNAAEGSRRMNIGDITKAATKSASKTLNKRMEPEKDFRSGLKTLPSKISSRTSTMNDSSIYIKDIHNQAIKASNRELNKVKTRTLGIQTASDKGLAVNPANFASSALKLDISTNGYADAERATLKNNSLVDKSIFAIASKKVDSQMSKLDKEVADSNIFSNIKFTESAYQIAQENALKRKEKELKPGQIGLGGGLRMDYKQIEDIANSLVKPALSDMEERIVEMRQTNAEKKALPGKIKQREIEHQEELRQAQIALEKKRAEEAKARRDQLALDKKAYDDEHEQIKSDLADNYAAQEDEFNKQVEDENAQKKVIDDEREAKLKVLNDEKSAKDSERQAELDDMQKIRDDDIAPLLSELEIELGKLSELTATREEKEAFFNEENSKTNEIQTELDGVLSKIDILNKRIEELEESLVEISNEEATATSAALASETKLNGEGSEKKNNLKSLSTEREDLIDKRSKLHTDVSEKANEIKELSKGNHEEEKEINGIYPEHLRKELVEPADFDDEDLNDSKFELDDSPIEEPAEIEDEPEDIPEEVWPVVEEPEPEPVEEEEEENDGEGLTTDGKDSDGIATAKAEPRKIVKKKTWEEIKASGPVEGGDPLVNVPTEEKPSMVDVVNDAKVKASVENSAEIKKNLTASKNSGTAAVTTSNAEKSTTPGKSVKKKSSGYIVSAVPSQKTKKVTEKPATKTSATGTSTSVQPSSKQTAAGSTGVTRSVPVIKSGGASKGLFGFLKGNKTETKDFIQKTEVINPEEAKKKFKGLQDDTPVNQDDDVFSGFSQGSEVEDK